MHCGVEIRRKFRSAVNREADEKKHVKKLNKRRAKELRSQRQPARGLNCSLVGDISRSLVSRSCESSRRSCRHITHSNAQLRSFKAFRFTSCAG